MSNSPLRGYVDRAVKDLLKPERAADLDVILRSFLFNGALLHLKPEWDMDDGINTTEDVANDFERHAPGMTGKEQRGIAREWDIDTSDIYESEGSNE